MRLLRLASIVFTLVFLIVQFGQGQNPTIQDCLGAIPVCEQIYSENVVPDGFGLFANEVTDELTCLRDDLNAIWYTFTVNTSGDFGFLLTPNDPNDDYDWALYNLTNAECSQIRNDISLLVSCNAAGNVIGAVPDCNGATGATGQSQFDRQGGGCGSPIVDLENGNSAFNDLIPVVQGNTYALIVSNYSQSNNGYTIDFGLSGNIGIIDMTPPETREVWSNATPGCAPEFFDVEFTELVSCSSIADQNFELTDALGNRYDVILTSEDCEIGADYSRLYRVEVDDVLPSGDYTLTIEGDPTFSIVDACGNPALDGSYSFQVTADGLSDINLPLDTLLCDQAMYVMDVFDPAATGYLWQDGSTNNTFTATTSGIYTVEVSTLCETKQATIDVEILNDRSFTLTLGPDTTLCLGDSYTLSAGLSGDYNYNWSDGNTDGVRTIVATDTYGVIVSDACGKLAEDEVQVTFRDIPIDVNLGRDTFFCTGDVIQLDATVVNGEVYQWDDGSADAVRSINTTRDYTVVVSNECESDEDVITIRESACIDCNVYIPNVMTLSSTGDNALFGVVSNCPFIEYSISVFDRWGGLMFTSQDPVLTWNGQLNGQMVLSGSYPYIVSVSYLEFDQLITEDYSGAITVIR